MDTFDSKKAESTAAIRITPDDLADHDKIRRAAPGTREQLATFGEEAYVPLGKDKLGREKYRIDVKGKKNVHKLFEMYEQHERLKAERGLKFQSRIPRARMLNRQTGEQRDVYEFNADKVGRTAGFVERPYYGRPSFRKSDKEYLAEMKKNV